MSPDASQLPRLLVEAYLILEDTFPANRLGMEMRNEYN